MAAPIQPNDNNFMTILNQFKQNPMAMLSQRFNIPQNMNDPNQIIQHLLNSGQVSQADVNRVMQIRNNPQIQNLFK